MIEIELVLTKIVFLSRQIIKSSSSDDVIEGEDNERLQFTSQNLQFWLSLFAQN
jgi:hypothetical protein